MLQLKTSHEKAIALLMNQDEDVHKLQKDPNTGEPNFYAVVEWVHTTTRLFEAIYGENDKHSMDYVNIVNGISPDNPQEWIQHSINISRAIIRSNIKEIHLLNDNSEFQKTLENPKEINRDEKLSHIFSKFHNTANILGRCRKNCSSFLINNEYDVQLLMYGLLSFDFEHIRVEEPTGSHAGSASKMVFVLDDEQTILEIKYAFNGHIDKEIGEELLLDISKYESEKKYSTFFCFIYDPGNKIRNAPILKKDLEGHSNEHFDIIVIIEPKR